MAYLFSALATAAGFVVLIVLLARLAGAVGGLARTVRASRARLTDRCGALTVQIAALRDERALRWRRGGSGGSAGSPAA